MSGQDTVVIPVDDQNTCPTEDNLIRITADTDMTVVCQSQLVVTSHDDYVFGFINNQPFLIAIPGVVSSVILLLHF